MQNLPAENKIEPIMFRCQCAGDGVVVVRQIEPSCAKVPYEEKITEKKKPGGMVAHMESSNNRKELPTEKLRQVELPW